MKIFYALILVFGLFGCGYKHVPQKAYIISYSNGLDRSALLKTINAHLEGMELKGPGAEKPVFEQGDVINREYFKGDFHISLYSEKPFELMLTCVESRRDKELSGDALAKCATAVFLMSTIKGVIISDFSKH